jgi:cytohesin
VDIADESGVSPLEEAAWKGQASIVAILLKHGADPKRLNPTTKSGPLHVAAQKGHAEVIQLLLAAGASPTLPDGEGALPLDLALRSRKLAAADALLAHGVKLDKAQTRLETAVVSGQTDLVQWLLAHGGNANAPTANGSTPLHDAALKGHLDVLRLLLAAGAQVSTRNASGASPLHDAALAGHRDAAALLLERGADLNLQETETGATPLFLAASWGRLPVVEFLLERGANRLLRNKAGKTPREIATENGYTDVAALL